MSWKRWIRISARISASFAAALVLISTSGPSSAEIKDWNQEEVTLLAKQLSESVTSLRLATINDPMVSTARDSRTGIELRDSLRLLEQACRQFARKLESGEDRAQTTGVAKKLGALIRRTQRAGRGMMQTESQWAAIDPAIDFINRLSPYYSEKSALLPPAQQR